MQIALANAVSIKLKGIALVLECKSNLISLKQLRDSKIIYHNKETHMLLTQNSLPITQVRRDQNLFVQDIAVPEKVIQTNIASNKHAMMTTGRKKPTYLVNHQAYPYLDTENKAITDCHQLVH